MLGAVLRVVKTRAGQKQAGQKQAGRREIQADGLRDMQGPRVRPAR